MDRERILETRLRQREEMKKVVAVITPFPISSAVFSGDVRGSILRYMFPCDGTILKGMIRLGKKLTDPAMLKISITDVGSKSQTISISSKVSVIEQAIEILTGECLDISIEPGSEKITEVWVSFLWLPSTKEVETKSYLRKELEAEIL
jgi:hypothetical protein